MNAAPDLVILGSLIVDDIEFTSGATRLGLAGGAALYAALGASLWGARVGLVSRRGTDYPVAVLAALADRGVDLAGVVDLGRPGGRTWLRYRAGRRTIEPQAGRPGHLEISPTVDDIPEHFLAARHFHVAPMPFAVQRALVDRLSRLPGARISLDPNLPLRSDTLEGWRHLLRRVDLLLVGQDEVQLAPSAEDWPRQFALDVGGRLAQVIAKRGAAGGVLYDRASDSSTAWQAGPWPVVEPTGAGDSLAGGVLSGQLVGQPLELALQRGLVSASLALAQWGPDGLLEATLARARARLAELQAAS
ncbi:MAG: carbohydrate kinase family protein [Deltaproteobacteria bacterium]|nr:carbohydrate kinase family protein [Deltaproteobacteria bacterium]